MSDTHATRAAIAQATAFLRGRARHGLRRGRRVRRLRRARGADRAGDASSPGSAAAGRRCSCCTATRRPTSCGTPRRRCWPSRHTVVVADLPGYGASFRPAPDPGPRRALQAGARASTWWRRWPRSATTASRSRGTTAAGGWPTGWRWTIPTACARPPCSTSCRPARCGPAPTPRWRSGYWHWAFLAQPAPLPERLIAGRPRRVLRPPRPRARPRPRTGPLPGGADGGLPRPARRPGHGAGDLRGLPRRGRRSTATTTTPTAARAASSARSSPLWSARGALPRFYGDVLDVWRPWARQITGQGLDAQPLPRRGPARAGRRPAVRLPPAVRRGRPLDPLGRRPT